MYSFIAPQTQKRKFYKTFSYWKFIPTIANFRPSNMSPEAKKISCIFELEYWNYFPGGFIYENNIMKLNEKIS